VQLLRLLRGSRPELAGRRSSVHEVDLGLILLLNKRYRGYRWLVLIAQKLVDPPIPSIVSGGLRVRMVHGIGGGRELKRRDAVKGLRCLVARARHSSRIGSACTLLEDRGGPTVLGRCRL